MLKSLNNSEKVIIKSEKVIIMSDHPSNTPYLTSTYQSALTKALIDTIIARNSGNIDFYWSCVETLFYVCPNRVMEEISEKVNQIITDLAHITSKGTTYNATQQQLSASVYRYKQRNVDVLFSVIMTSLRKNKYAEIETGARPKFESKGHLG